MATTTNYGWTTPNDSDPFKDGALAIRTLGNAIDSTLGSFFNIKQIVTSSYSTSTSTSTNAKVATGLTATITPSSTSSKILIFVSHGSMSKNSGNAITAIGTFLYRGATELASHLSMGFNNTNNTQYLPGDNYVYFDAPATTSATTYSTKFYSENNTASVSIQVSGSRSEIILVEVEA